MKEEKLGLFPDPNGYVVYDSNGYISYDGVSNWEDFINEQKRVVLASDRARKIDSILS